MTKTRSGDALISMAFLLLILLPSADSLLKLDRFRPLAENRELAPFPRASLNLHAIKEFAADYSAYFMDNFGFRNSLVRLNFVLRYRWGGTSPSKLVVRGADDWLFYSGDGEMDDRRGVRTFDEAKLQSWARTLQRKKAWLEDQGIRYVFFVPPNKSTIYGEFLPAAYDKVRERTALDELVEYLREHTDVAVVDARPALRAARPKERLYFRTDTHWNEYGAFLAYREILEVVAGWFPGMHPTTLDDYRLVREQGPGGDLAVMVGGPEFLEEEHVRLEPLPGKAARADASYDPKRRPLTFESQNTSLPRAYVFRDSFLANLVPFLSQHFSHVTYRWQPWNSSVDMSAVVAAERPDVVIEEISERLLDGAMADFEASCPPYLGHHCQR